MYAGTKYSREWLCVKKHKLGAIFEMKFAGKRWMTSTEGVTLSGADGSGATANGSTLWRHPDKKSGAEGATYRRDLNRLWESLRQMDREDITVLKVSYLIIQLSPPKFCILI